MPNEIENHPHYECKLHTVTSKVHSDLHESVRRSLSSHAIRYTAGRRRVIESMTVASGPLSAAELLDATEAVPLSSLYRSLTVLDEAGVLRRHHDADGLARFELAEWLTGHHHHAVCRNCGLVEDIELSTEEETALDDMLSSLSTTSGWNLSSHSLEVEGTCAGCNP